MEEHKVKYFQRLEQTGKTHGFKTCAHCQVLIYTERIALASSSNELHQIVNALSNRHPPNILPTIYISADLPTIFIRHCTNKEEKHRTNFASEHVTSTFVTGTTAATFSSFDKVSLLTVKECVPTSAPMACELYPIPYKLLVECMDFILLPLTNLFNSSHVSDIFPQCFNSIRVTPILEKYCLDHNDVNYYQPASNLCFMLKFGISLSHPKFFPTSTLIISTAVVNQNIVQ